MRIFATQYIEGLKEEKERLKDEGIILEWNLSSSPLSRDDLYKEALESDGLITMLCDNIDAAFLEKNSHLKIISNYAVGTNNFDILKAKDLNIHLGHTPDVLTHTTAETALTLLLNISRRTQEAMSFVKEGQWKTWEPTLFNGMDLRQKTIGIVGDGRIGSEFSRMAQALWSCEVLTYPYKDRGVSEEEFFSRCDVVSLHCPLNSHSEKMINDDFIKRMKKPFLFINTARGACHDEQALLKGLELGKILAIGLDVTDPEPLEMNSPLLEKKNVVIFPHIGSATDRTRLEMTKICLENCLRALKVEALLHSV